MTKKIMKIRSLLLTAVLATAVLCSPVAVSAASLTSAQISAIIQLLQVFGADSATIANVQTSLNGGTPSINASPVAWCHTFNNNLGVGSLGNEVAALHGALNKEGFDSTSWRADNFTEITGSAVVKFQKKYGIPQTGFVGPLTRAKLNALYKCGTTQNSTQPSITVTSPNGGETWMQGSIHNITWQDNFTTSNNIVRIVLISQGAGILGLIYQGVDNGYYAWNGQVSVGAGQYSGPGDYKLKICKGDACDDSDNYFTITQ
jgi:peptidoglycan hydrolase-like protein with peptidoglycan-binding domain